MFSQVLASGRANIYTLNGSPAKHKHVDTSAEFQIFSKQKGAFLQGWRFISCQIFLKMDLDPSRINYDWLGFIYKRKSTLLCSRFIRYTHRILHVMSQQYLHSPLKSQYWTFILFLFYFFSTQNIVA